MMAKFNLTIFTLRILIYHIGYQYLPSNITYGKDVFTRVKYLKSHKGLEQQKCLP